MKEQGQYRKGNLGFKRMVSRDQNEWAAIPAIPLCDFRQAPQTAYPSIHSSIK